MESAGLATSVNIKLRGTMMVRESDPIHKIKRLERKKHEAWKLWKGSFIVKDEYDKLVRALNTEINKIRRGG
jgi:hypothetical protein